MMNKNGSAVWPKDFRGDDLPTQPDPVTGIPICRDCWDGKHKRNGCEVPGCLCGCYHGRNKGLGKPHAPAKDCKDQENLPDVGTITV